MPYSLFLTGFELYCVGVGKSFDKDKTSIKMLASKPIHDHTIKASYNSLNKTMPLLFKKLSLGKWKLVSNIL